MKYEYICKYCDNKWIVEWKISSPSCNKCRDKNLKIKVIDEEKNNVFGYEEENEDEEDPVDWFNKTIKWGSD